MKKWLILLAAVLLVGIGAGIWKLGLSKKSPDLSDRLPAENSGKLSPVTVQLSAWEDPAGFSFKYSMGVKINNHPEDKDNFANLALTIPKLAGQITILMQENGGENLEAWSVKQVTAGGQVIDTTLGGEAAKKAIFTEKEILAVIDKEAILTIECPLSGAGWKDACSEIVSSLEFTPIKAAGNSAAPASANTSSDGEAIEEEEIVE